MRPWTAKDEAEFCEDLDLAVRKRLQDPVFAMRFCARCRFRDDVHGVEPSACEEFVKKGKAE
jgi:hypothetical protein